MMVTVAICTWNRAELLGMTLKQMRLLRVPKDIEWELLIINNACTDHTDEVVAEHVQALPLRLIHEATPGKSHAANRAVAESRGELILWTDDDVLVDSDWMERYVDAASDERYDFFGGTIDPLFASEAPYWIQQNLDYSDIYAVLQLGPETRPLTEKEFAYGANMAFRTEVLKRFRFDPALGPIGDNQVRSEETELQKLMTAAGHRGLWVGSSRVRHNIPTNRLGVHFVRSWFRGGGRSVAIMEGPQEIPHVLGFPRPAIRKFVEIWLKQLLRMPRKDRAWLEAMTQSAYLEGYLLEARRIRRESFRLKN